MLQLLLQVQVRPDTFLKAEKFYLSKESLEASLWILLDERTLKNNKSLNWKAIKMVQRPTYLSQTNHKASFENEGSRESFQRSRKSQGRPQSNNDVYSNSVCLSMYLYKYFHLGTKTNKINGLFSPDSWKWFQDRKNVKAFGWCNSYLAKSKLEVISRSNRCCPLPAWKGGWLTQEIRVTYVHQSHIVSCSRIKIRWNFVNIFVTEAFNESQWHLKRMRLENIQLGEKPYEIFWLWILKLTITIKIIRWC